MKGTGGGSSFSLFRPCGLIVLSLLIQNCSLSNIESNSFIRIKPVALFLETISTGVIVRESIPPQILLVKCSNTRDVFLLSEWCETRFSCTDLY